MRKIVACGVDQLDQSPRGILIRATQRKRSRKLHLLSKTKAQFAKIGLVGNARGKNCIEVLFDQEMTLQNRVRYLVDDLQFVFEPLQCGVGTSCHGAESRFVAFSCLTQS